MPPIDFGHTSNPDKSGFASSQRLVNGYTESIGQGGKTPIPVYATPGTVRFDQGTSPLDGPCRGLLYVYGKGLVAVGGTKAALFDDAGNATAIAGTIGGTAPVIMAANQEVPPKVGVVAEDGYYVLNTGTLTVAKAAIANLPQPNSVTFLDGYFVFSIPDGRIFHSALNDAGTVNALAFATAQSRSDGLRRIAAHRGALFALGETSLEIWENAGTTPFAFARIRADIDIGCIAEQTVATVGDSLLWVDHTGMVRQARGSEPQRVSTHAVERAIGRLPFAERRGLFAVRTHFNGHDFYAITSPYWTWELDLATGLWHERQSGGRDGWFARGFETFNGKVMVGSLADSGLHLVDDAAYTESGVPYVFLCQSAPISGFPGGGIVHELAVDAITGVGLTGSDADAADPKVMLKWSDDGGATWAGPRVASLGRVGQRGAVVSFYQLGAFGRAGRTFQLSASSRVMRGILQADARVSPTRV
jgi:hypothetical protein